MLTAGTSAEYFSVYDKEQGPFWSEKADAEIKTRFAPKGIASAKEIPELTVPQLMEMAAKRAPKRIALMQEPLDKIQVDKDNKWPEPLPRSQWLSWTWTQYEHDCKRAAKALIKLGHVQHDAVTIFGFNSPAWMISAVGTMCAGGKATGVYPSDTPEQLRFKCEHSDSSVIIMETNGHLASLAQIIDGVPYIKAAVVWGQEPAKAELTRADGTVVPVLSWEKFLNAGADISDADYKERESKIRAGHCCSIIYTSGTTGNPKAVMISHDNIVFEARVVMAEGIPAVGAVAGEEDRILSYLPLSHVAGQMVDVACPIIVTAIKPGYCTVYFARPYDLKLGSIGDRLRDVQPTIFLGVPRVWEKVAEKVKAVGASVKGIKKKLATWAKSKGLAYQRNIQLGGSRAKPAFFGLADGIILKKVQGRLGLTSMKFGFTGAAPCSVDTLEYFGSLGINVNEVYGMSECTGATTWSTDKKHIWGSVGYGLGGQEVKIVKPRNGNEPLVECPRTKNLLGVQPEECIGEIVFRGRHIMMGYLANPKLGPEHVEEIRKKNAECIDEEGWCHSGDAGVMDANGMVRITGRFKELIITAGGENCAPVPIEADIVKNGAGIIASVQMIGDRRKYNVALITLAAEGASGEKPGNNVLAGKAAAAVPGVTTIEEAVSSPEFVALVEKAIKTTNANGAVVPSQASRITKFTILPRDFSVETGELTATLKLRRQFAEKLWEQAVEGMFSEEAKDMYVKYTGGIPTQ